MYLAVSNFILPSPLFSRSIARGFNRFSVGLLQRHLPKAAHPTPLSWWTRRLTWRSRRESRRQRQPPPSVRRAWTSATTSTYLKTTRTCSAPTCLASGEVCRHLRLDLLRKLIISFIVLFFRLAYANRKPKTINPAGAWYVYLVIVQHLGRGRLRRREQRWKRGRTGRSLALALWEDCVSTLCETFRFHFSLSSSCFRSLFLPSEKTLFYSISSSTRRFVVLKSSFESFSYLRDF